MEPISFAPFAADDFFSSPEGAINRAPTLFFVVNALIF